MWIMTPFKEEGHHTVLELMYNKKHKRGCFVMENVLAFSKKHLESSLPKLNFMFLLCQLHSLLVVYYIFFYDLNLNHISKD
jgi:hypothetical protein